jgi:hypothetical protein
LDKAVPTAEIAADVLDDFLLAACDDWVYLAELQGIVIQVAADHGVDLRRGRDSDASIIRMNIAMAVIGTSLREQLVRVGDLPPPGEFIPWSLSSELALARVQAEWAGFGSELSLGDVCWFEISEAGRSLAEAIRPRAQERWMRGRA